MSVLPGHAAVLLAAGGSRRLGRPKQLLTRGGAPLVRRVAQMLLATGAAPVLVVLGGEGPGVRAALEGLPVDLVENPDWTTGLAGSLRTAAQALAGQRTATLLAAVDQPRLEAAHLQALLAAWTPEADVASRYGEAFGIPALVRPATLKAALALGGDAGFRQIWKNHPDALRLVDAPELADDIDTPQDLENAARQGWVDPP